MYLFIKSDDYNNIKYLKEFKTKKDLDYWANFDGCFEILSGNFNIYKCDKLYTINEVTRQYGQNLYR